MNDWIERGGRVFLVLLTVLVLIGTVAQSEPAPLPTPEWSVRVSVSAGRTTIYAPADRVSLRHSVMGNESVIEIDTAPRPFMAPAPAGK